MSWSIKKLTLLAFSAALLITSGVSLWQYASQFITKKPANSETSYSVKQTNEANLDLTAAFKPETVQRITFQESNVDLFDLLLVNYQDQKQQPQNALLFAKAKNESVMLPSPTGLRQKIWQTAAQTIIEKAPKDALFLSWWDDSQRLHFLSDRDVWLNKPGQATFISPLWAKIKAKLIIASTAENERLTTMARWLTMESEQALTDIRQTLGTRPLYLLVNNDLLMRLAEMVDYGGTPLAITSKQIPASNDLHNDISHIKQIAQEQGDGNYLIQKEGKNYRLWLTAKQATSEKNSLLIRLLPFVESLKQLPEGVELVYQSHGDGYLSIYRINPKPITN